MIKMADFDTFSSEHEPWLLVDLAAAVRIDVLDTVAVFGDS